MQDVLFVATIVLFFVLANAYLRFCDRIVGADDETERRA